ncbi:MAG TPA: fumarylacetoacetate hydrolase family protein [Kineosporiaceae bacterium]|nr:fumarylacetoacetate hydrolase family protein [Kineosporiaceae bacterium]
MDGHAVLIDTTATTTADLLANYHTGSDPAELLAAACSAPVEVAGLRLLSPVTAPCRVVALAVNYRSHAHDCGLDPQRVQPTFFRKASGSITGPAGPIVRPTHVRLLDNQVELGLVIGAPIPVGTTIEEADLARYVAGLVVTDIVSARDLQLPYGQCYESTSYPSFTPVGPRLVLVGAAELRRLAQLRLQSSVNGDLRQDGLGADMIVSPARALTALSRFQELAPGDLVLTGTPGGTALQTSSRPADPAAALLPTHADWAAFLDQQAANPAHLHDGDIVEARIATDDGSLDLGVQRHPVRSALMNAPPPNTDPVLATCTAARPASYRSAAEWEIVTGRSNNTGFHVRASAHADAARSR